MQMIEFRKQIRHLIARGHVLGDLLATSVIVDVSVGIDDLHTLSPPKASAFAPHGGERKASWRKNLKKLLS
jgi:hypothetical protein